MFQRRKYTPAIMLFSMMVLSLCAHLFFIISSTQGTYMKGINDGLSQMLPFKQFIYEKYARRDFFYAADFGLGGDFFSSLAYYFSTNLFFLPWVVGTWLVSQVVPLTIDVNYWLALVLPMSIVKQTAIMYIAFLFLRKVSNMPKAAYVAAIFYAVSPFFFRHELYWDILTDEMFWLPLSLLGIEKIIRRESSTLFTLAVAAVMISNFYLAYMTLLIGGIYIVIRLFYRLSEYEQTKKGQLFRYIGFGLLGAGMSLFAFIPAAQSFLNNVRPPFQDPIEWLNINDDIFMNPRVLWLPVFIFILFFIRYLYRVRTYRLFAMIAAIGLVGHFIPYVGSIFNGFSAPQQRWESLIILSFSVMLTFALHDVKQWQYQKGPLNGIIAFLLVWFGFELLMPQYDIAWPLASGTICWIVFFFLFYFYKWSAIWLASSIIIASLLQANYFSYTLTQAGDGVATKTFIDSERYNAPEQQQLVDWMKNHLDQDDYRIDWMAPLRNNTPIIQNFNGTSVYSSILNGHLLYFYWDDLQIDMTRESVSRYGTLGSRANLMALEQVQFYMRDSSNSSVPDGYKLVKEHGQYHVYETKQLLPAFRVAKTSYDEAALANAPILAKEHAMLNGVIREDGQASPPPVKRLDHDIDITGGSWDQQTLQIDDSEGVVDVQVKPSKRAKTLYMTFYIEGIRHQDSFEIRANEYYTTRKKSDSIYRTNANTLTLAVKADDHIRVTLPKGTYRFRDVAVYEEDGRILKHALQRTEAAQMTWDDGDAYGTVTAEDGDILATSIPYEKGWRATIDGERVDVEKVNYAFVGVPLTAGQHKVTLHYLPPYWPYVAWLSLIAAVVFMMTRWIRRKSSTL